MAEFWRLIGSSSIGDASDIDVALTEISRRLASLNPFELVQFSERLKEALYRLDRREFGEIPVALMDGREFPQTSDHFLYARCACVMAGGEVYSRVLQSGVGFDHFVKPSLQRAEGLLYIASNVYEAKTGEKIKLKSGVSVESMSNTDGWLS
ncbi:MAG: DUF4240 domain-containing protein [Actinomadura sp.]